MIRFKNISNPYWRNMVSRTVLVIVAVVLIVLFLPRTQGKLFHYDEGKPWMYGQLIAKRQEIENFQYDAHTRLQMRNSLTMSKEEDTKSHQLQELFGGTSLRELSC